MQATVFSTFGDDYKFPPVQVHAEESPEGSLTTTPASEKKQTEGGLVMEELTQLEAVAESLAEVQMCNGVTGKRQDAQAEAAAANGGAAAVKTTTDRRVSSGGPSARTRRQSYATGITLATTCNCDLGDPEIARAKKHLSAAPKPTPKLYIPRAFCEMRRCPSCDRDYNPIGHTHTEKERLACILEDHWPCLIHLTLTGRLEAVFAEE
ncbi:hypothetical protein JCM10908_003604 [Rhodotorula pacifica]|uniref:uncharacterized protein n=1 Tax=Rhodotorula pacifica TaxID=1495444 RepID=UPI00317211D6